MIQYNCQRDRASVDMRSNGVREVETLNQLFDKNKKV